MHKSCGIWIAIHIQSILGQHVKHLHYEQVKVSVNIGSLDGPHRGLPPCSGGGAYAPMTRTICNLNERS